VWGNPQVKTTIAGHAVLHGTSGKYEKPGPESPAFYLERAFFFASAFDTLSA
jgi:hypothetical protein